MQESLPSAFLYVQSTDEQSRSLVTGLRMAAASGKEHEGTFHVGGGAVLWPYPHVEMQPAIHLRWCTCYNRRYLGFKKCGSLTSDTGLHPDLTTYVVRFHVLLINVEGV